jgi:hypothetical protein
MVDGDIDLDTLPGNKPDLCVPRSLSVPSNEELLAIFRQVFGVDSIRSVDVLSRNDPKHSERRHHRIFVHFARWPRSPRFDALRKRALRGDSIKIVYDYPSYWKCYESKQTSRPTPHRVWLGGTVGNCGGE